MNNSTTEECITLPSNLSLHSAGQWDLPLYAVVFSVIYLSIDIVFGFFSNTLLIMIIYSSPSLRTPPNMHLVNISINNLILCICMIFSLISVSGRSEDIENIRALTGIQLFLVTTCSMQYLCTFSSIGFYRNRTMQKPSLSLKVRKTIVSRSIMVSWLVTHLLGLVFSLAYVGNDQVLNYSISPFQRTFKFGKTLRHLGAEQICASGLIIVSYVIGSIIIFKSYHNICRTLNFTGKTGRNRVVPINRNLSLSSDAAGELQVRKQYIPEDGVNFKPYSITNETFDSSIVVHYHKNEHSLAFEDIFALENPILANTIRNHHQKQALRATLSNTSQASTKSKVMIEFSDISPSGDLQRLQTLKNNSVLKMQSLRRDRISLSSATKNSMIMLAAYVTCSLPLLICSMPCVLNGLKGDRIIVVLFCRLLFYLNVCIYPLWYLIFSKRVRKCMFRMFENMLIRLKLRR